MFHYRRFATVTLGAAALLASAPAFAQLSFTDNFATGLNPSYWTTTQTTPGLYTVDATHGNVQIAKTNQNNPGGLQNTDVVLNLNNVAGGPITGDFTTQIQFSNAVLPGPGLDQLELHTNYQDASIFFDVRDNSAGSNVHVWNGSSVNGTTGTAATSGTFRISRTGATVSGYFNNALIYSETHASPLTKISFTLQNNTGSNDQISGTFANFSLSAPGVAAPEASSLMLLGLAVPVLRLVAVRRKQG